MLDPVSMAPVPLNGNTIWSATTDSSRGQGDESTSATTRDDEHPTATVTLLFTDIEGSTRQWEQSPAMADLVARHFDVLRAAVDGAGGEVFATLGDGIAAAFDAAGSAVARRRRRPSASSPRSGSTCAWASTPARSSGPATTTAAARSTGRRGIMAVGHGGQILVSDVTAALLRSGSAATRRRARRRRDPPAARPRRAGAACGRSCTPTSSAGSRPLAAGDGTRTALPDARARRSSGASSTPSTSPPCCVTSGSSRSPASAGVGKTRLALRVPPPISATAVRPTSWFVRWRGSHRSRRRRRRRSPSPSAPAVRPARRLARPRPPCSGGPGAARRRQLRARDRRRRRRSSTRSPTALPRAARSWRPAARPLGVEGEHVVDVRPLPIATGGRRAVPPAGRGGRRRRSATDPVGDRGPVRPPRRPAAGHRAGRRPRGDARRGRHRRRPRRPRRCCDRAARRRSDGHGTHAGDDRVVVPAARSRRAAAVPAGSPPSPTASSSTPCSTSRHRLGIAAAGGHPPPRVARAQEHGHGRRARPRGRSLPDARDGARLRPRAARRRTASGRRRARAMADWVATIAGLPADDPCSAAVERARSASSGRPTTGARRSCVAARARLGRARRRPVRSAGRLLPPRSPRPRRRRRARCSTSAPSRANGGRCSARSIVTASGGTDPSQLAA